MTHKTRNDLHAFCIVGIGCLVLVGVGLLTPAAAFVG